MTIITKPISEKKEAKAKLPLVDNDQLAASAPPDDVETQLHDEHFVLLRARARFLSSTFAFCLIVMLLFLTGVGIIGSTYLYRQFRSPTFRGWCNVPYGNNAESASLINSDNFKDDMDDGAFETNLEEMRKNYNNLVENVFKEYFEIDVKNEDYEKIDVPDFRNGRIGRFVHDFNTNKTGIVDLTGKRCFIMPLNRDNVLPPRTLEDLIKKMWDGYYKVNTEIIRETMRVVTPPVTDIEEIGSYIARECDGMPIYKLEKYDNPVWKRSADPLNDAKFTQFSGKGILELDIVNLNDVIQFERDQGH